MFYIFIRACRKYGFSYAINANFGLILTLFSNNTLEKIEIKQEYYNKNYFKLFLMAIKRMKEYKRGRGAN